MSENHPERSQTTAEPWSYDDEMSAFHDLADLVEQSLSAVPASVADALRKLREVQNRELD